MLKIISFFVISTLTLTLIAFLLYEAMDKELTIREERELRICQQYSNRACR